MLPMGPVKIVATLGPASSDGSTIRAMADAGVSVFRLNCSHAGPAELRELARTVRTNAPEAALLLDLQGPKLRTGGQSLTLVTGTRCTLHAGALSFNPIVLGVEVGQRLLLGDGRVEACVVAIDADGALVVDVRQGGELRPRQGVHLPDTDIRIGPLTDEDRRYVAMVDELAVEWVALSYVRHADDITLLRSVLGDRARVVAKIERREALENLETIVEAADALMAARGDLGVEIPFEEVPQAQQRIAQAALLAGKVVICATEMLESMRTESRPTRAEVADVHTAVCQGFGAVMLSAETATGAHPIEVVTAMRRICDAAATEISYRPYADRHPKESAVSAAAAALAVRTGADAILALTITGVSAQVLSACRPPVPIIAATPSPEVGRGLALHWGVRPLVVTRPEKLRHAVEAAREAAVHDGLLRPGAELVVTASRNDPGAAADTIWVHEP